MKWAEVRTLYPDQWVKLKIINSHKENDYLYIDEMDIIQTISNDKDATRELVNCKGDNIVFHTNHNTIQTKIIKNMGLFRRIPN
ncbi:hypothetical protein [Clostridium sp.]|uniref:hypothetical protein n=1 Tax=Clostridium sp. TaxID=1506 RepID=UPI003D6CEC9C